MIMIKHHHILEFPILNPLALCWNCLRFFCWQRFQHIQALQFVLEPQSIHQEQSGEAKERAHNQNQIIWHFTTTISQKQGPLFALYKHNLVKDFLYGGLTLASEDNVCFIAWTLFLIYVCICIWKKLPCLDLQLWHTHTHISSGQCIINPYPEFNTIFGGIPLALSTFWGDQPAGLGRELNCL